MKAYGAGILSSVGELDYCVTDQPKFRPLDPHFIAQHNIEFPISTMQPHYYVADSFTSAKATITDYCEKLPRPFNVSFNPSTLSVEVDRKVHTKLEQPNMANEPYA